MYLKKLLYLIALLFIGNTVIYADSLNIRFVNKINYSSISSIAYAKIEGNNYALLGLDPGFKIIDVNEPNYIREVSQINTPDKVCGLVYSESYAYLAERGLTYTGGQYSDGVMRIIDVHDPYNPVPMGSITMPGSARNIKIVGDCAYVADISGVRVINISDKTNPVVIDSIMTLGGARDVDIRDTLAFIVFDFGIRIVDISDISNPNEISFCMLPGYCRKIIVDGNYAYIASGESGLKIIDISNPKNPLVVDSLTTNENLYAIAKNNDLLYMADGHYFGIANIVDPLNPCYSYHEFTWSSNIDIDISDTIAFLAGYSDVVNVISVKDSSNPQFIGNYDPRNGPHDITISGNYLYAGCWDGGLRIFGIINPEKIEEQGTYDEQFSFLPSDIAVVDSIAYIAAEGVRIFNVSDKRRPYEISSCADLYIANSVAVKENYAFLANGNYLSIFDISDIQNPIFSNRIEYPTLINNIIVDRNYAFLPLDSTGLNILDISDPTNPIKLESFYTAFKANDFIIKDSIAFLANDINGLIVLNISDINKLKEINHFNTRGRASKLFINGDILYTSGDTINVIDIIDPLNLNEIGYYGYICKQLACKDDYIFLSDDALTVLQYYGPLGVNKKDNVDLNNKKSIKIVFYNNSLKYNLESDTYLNLTLYNILGQEVKVLENSFKIRGVYKIKISGVPSGVYIAKLITSHDSAISRFVYVK